MLQDLTFSIRPGLMTGFVGGNGFLVIQRQPGGDVVQDGGHGRAHGGELAVVVGQGLPTAQGASEDQDPVAGQDHAADDAHDPKHRLVREQDRADARHRQDDPQGDAGDHPGRAGDAGAPTRARRRSEHGDEVGSRRDHPDRPRRQQQEPGGSRHSRQCARAGDPPPRPTPRNCARN